MQAVILAAGEGIRMRPLTLNTPKPLLPVLGQPLLSWTIKSFPKEIDEIIIVIGYLGDKIKDFFGSEFDGRSIKYVVQKQKLGTYDALKTARGLIKDDLFLTIYADDFFDTLSYERLIAKEAPAILVKEVADPKRFGVVTLNPDGSIKEIVEKPAKPESNLANCGPSVLNKRIFDYPPDKGKGGEYYLSESVSKLAKENKVYAVVAFKWLPIGFPEDLGKAEEFLNNNQGLGTRD